MTTTFPPKKKLFAAAMVISLWLACPFCSFGATANVTISSFAFTPATSTINVGDQVTWTWSGSPHTTTSNTSLWDSGTHNSGFVFSQTFNSGGSFPYHCTVHPTTMMGTITVNAASSPPTLSITNPTNSAVFTAPANVAIQVTVTNGSSAVTNVQFLVGPTVLTNDSSAPFSASTNNLPAGSYTLSAIASDNNGLKATNSVSITVDAPPTVTITNPAPGAVLSAPANVIVQAAASDSDGTVTNVQFLVGSTVLTDKAVPPFSATTNNLAAGSYTFSAVASDNLGVKNTNAVTVSVVTPVQTTFGGLQFLGSTNFQFSYAANTGLSYVVQWSTNLASANWVSTVTNVAASNPVVFTDIRATNSQTFYRVGRLPNP